MSYPLPCRANNELILWPKGVERLHYSMAANRVRPFAPVEALRVARRREQRVIPIVRVRPTQSFMKFNDPFRLP